MQIVMTGFAGDLGSMNLAAENAGLMRERFAPSFIRRFDGLCEEVSGEGALNLNNDEEICLPILDGLYAALWKLGECYGCGLEIYHRDVPIKQESIEICEVLDVNPYELASSGRVFMIPDGEAPAMGKVVGKSRCDNDRVVMMKNGVRYLEKR